jgi:hypothetical protein
MNVSLVKEIVRFNIVGLLIIFLIELIASPVIRMVHDPVSQTDPAEFVFARSTPHFLAAIILLD